MGEVLYQHGGVVVNERAQNVDCVEALEDLLARAKAGEIIGISYAIQYADDSSGHAASGFMWRDRIVGALMIQAQHHISEAPDAS